MKDITSNRLLFRLVPSEHRTEETASSLLPTVQTQGLKVCNENGKTIFYPVELLPTPTAIDGGTGRINKSLSQNAKERPTLALSAKMGLLPTPNAREADKYSKKYNPNSQMGTALTAMAVNGMLPTPTARDYQPSVSPQALKRENGKMRMDALCNLPVMLGEHHSQNGGKTSQLNPLFVAEMMGFSPDWTVLPFQSGGRNR